MGVATVTNQISTCQIWGEGYPAVGQNIPELSRIVVTESDRSGGGYAIPSGESTLLDGLDDRERARLTTWLVDQRLQGNTSPTVTKEVVEFTSHRYSLPIHTRADRLLKFLSSKTLMAGQSILLLEHQSNSERVQLDSFGSPINPDAPTNPIFLSAMAWSESTTPYEIRYLAKYLEDEGWVQEHTLKFPDGRVFPTSEYQVTVSGHVRVADEAVNIASSKAFVAMWFDDSLAGVFDEGIAPAIRECGFEAKRIDLDPNVDKIDDAIIAEIRQSRFLVADFTHGNEGARGGVYYEAGFAHGLGIPVIFTCRGDMIDQIHFDTRQYAHIVWNNSTELRKGLRDRILARIGNGPSIIQ